MNSEPKTTKNMSVLLGAAFLMATSAIGPGFLTQTSKFTAQYLASFAFVIVCVIIMDIIAQVNVWSVIGASGLRGQEIANRIIPGLGIFLAILVAIGGLAFNIGNVGGVSLGLNALAGIPQNIGCVLGGALAICIFLSKSGKSFMDKVAQILGGIIIITILVVCVTSKPPVGTAVMRIFTPENPKDLVAPMITLLGGSCGGYITFSGAHRLLDAGYGGEGDWKTAALTAVMKAMGENGSGASGFMEDYTYHLEEGREYSLGAHMLEVCPSLAAGKPRIETHPLGIGMNEKDPARLVFEGKAGKALVASLIDMGGRLRLVVQDIECVKPIMPRPNLPVARIMWRAMPDLTTGLECWITAGGAHHTVLSYDVTAEQLRDWARIMDIEFVHIGKDSSPEKLEEELRIKDLVWKLR